VMRITSQKPYQALCDQLADVRGEKSPLTETRFSGLLKHRYILRFREYDPSREPLMEIFLTQVEHILNAWISGATVEVRKEIGDAETGMPQIRKKNEE